MRYPRVLISADKLTPLTLVHVEFAGHGSELLALASQRHLVHRKLLRHLQQSERGEGVGWGHRKEGDRERKSERCR